MRSIDFSHSEAKIPINISQDYYYKNKENRSRFELLYENSTILNKKLDLMRAKNYYEKQEKMIPVISKKAQEINRPKDLFFKRLYNSNTNKIKKDNNNYVNKKGKEKNNNKTPKKEKKNKNDNNSFSSANNNNNKINDDEESLYIINNKEKNEEYKKLYKSPNLKKNNIFFLFKPTIDNNSKLIASKIKTKPKERLISFSTSQKINLNNILKEREMIKEQKLKEAKEKTLFKLNNNTYKPNVKNNKRKWIDKLYENGLNSMKQKEEKAKNEKLKNENEYLKYSFSPLINHNYSYTNFYKSKNYSTNNTYINNRNLNLNTNTKRNKTNNKISKSFSKTSIYVRNKKWKDLIEEKKTKLKNKLKNKLINETDYCFTPSLNNNIMETDISFIGKNMIEYETFLDKYNYSKYKKKLDKVIYRRINIPPKKIYQKKLVVEFVSECDSKCPTNSGTIKLTCDKRPINEIHRNREKLKINDFFGEDINLQSKVFFDNNKYNKNNENGNEYIIFDKNKSIGKEGLNPYINKNDKIIYRNDGANLSFFNAVNNIINKIE